MNIMLYFLLYVTLFRLAIITTGIISIVLGYYLLCKGILPKHKGGEGTSIEASIAGSSLMLKNAAPGTAFALFGVIVISIMLAKDTPEFNLEMLNKVNTDITQSLPPNTSKILLRGDENKTIEQMLRQMNETGVAYEKGGELDKAIKTYQETIRLVSDPLNNLAWAYQKQNELEKALPFAQVAVIMNPEQVDFIDTLAVILCKKGEQATALSWMEKAAQLKPDVFNERLEKLKKGSCE